MAVAVQDELLPVVELPLGDEPGLAEGAQPDQLFGKAAWAIGLRAVVEGGGCGTDGASAGRPTVVNRLSGVLCDPTIFHDVLSEHPAPDLRRGRLGAVPFGPVHPEG